MNDSLSFTEQNIKQLMDAGYRFIAVDEKENKMYALQKPMASGSLASLEWKQYQIGSEMINSLLQGDGKRFELHLIRSSGIDDEP